MGPVQSQEEVAHKSMKTQWFTADHWSGSLRQLRLGYHYFFPLYFYAYHLLHMDLYCKWPQIKSFSFFFGGCWVPLPVSIAIHSIHEHLSLSVGLSLSVLISLPLTFVSLRLFLWLSLLLYLSLYLSLFCAHCSLSLSLPLPPLNFLLFCLNFPPSPI